MKTRHYRIADWLRVRVGSLLMMAGLVAWWGAIGLAAPQSPATTERDDKFQRDREAILAMAGNYYVRFSFRETVPFVEGYQLKKPYETDGHETVRVIRDEGDFISLQHILVVDGIWEDHAPIKHWRQDWLFEPAQILEYAGCHVWRTRHLDEGERRGKWAQHVYQVDDSPRYGAIAEWTYEHGSATWAPPSTWRPLPRRERTKRDDYDVLISVNRHALTPDGWVHEQDNSKLILQKEPQLLAREIGVNTYTSSDDFDYHIAENYWDETKAFWAEVRDEWNQLHQQAGAFRVDLSSESGKLYNQILILAKDVREGTLDLEAAAMRARKLIRTSTTTQVPAPGSSDGVQDHQSDDERGGAGKRCSTRG
jgi:hypothetical protein